MMTIGRTVTVLGAIVLAAAVASAQDRSKGNEGEGGSPSGPAGTSSQGSSGTGSTAAASASSADSQHAMRGTVKTVDKSTGEVQIVVPGIDDEISIHLPPGEISGFERGDQVVVSMELREARVGTDRPDAK